MPSCSRASGTLSARNLPRGAAHEAALDTWLAVPHRVGGPRPLAMGLDPARGRALADTGPAGSLFRLEAFGNLAAIPAHGLPGLVRRTMDLQRARRLRALHGPLREQSLDRHVLHAEEHALGLYHRRQLGFRAGAAAGPLGPAERDLLSLHHRLQLDPA